MGDSSDSQFVPVQIDRGMWSSGDPTLIPPGFCKVCRNLVLRPLRLETRPPMVYDSLMTIRSLAVFDDQANKAQRGLAINSSPNLFMKGTSGETWSASLGSVGSANARLTDFANYRGKGYGMLDNGTAGLPASAFSFDGTNIDTTPFDSPIQGRTITPYLDRLFITYPRVTVTPLNSLNQAYYSTSGGAWGFTNVNQKEIADGTRTTVRLSPTSASTSSTSCFASSIFTISSSTTPTPITFRYDIRCVEATFDAELTLKAIFSVGLTHSNATPYALGDIVLADNLIWRCVQAGTSDNPKATLTGSVGTSVTDNTVIWYAENVVELNVTRITISKDDNGQWQTFVIDAVAPWRTHTVTLGAQLVFGHRNQRQGVISDAQDIDGIFAIDVAYKDGLTDGDARKRNYGFQATTGDYRFPFVNTEVATSSTHDLKTIIFSEVLQPNRFRASATYELQTATGYPTAAAQIGARYIVFTRSAFWVFDGNQNVTSLDVIPIIREREYLSVGCLGPRALDSIDDDLYFIGENGIYRFNVGMNDPEEIAGDAMKEEIMDRGANWVESQATYNMPILRINERDKEVWVYTQKSKVYVYNIAIGKKYGSGAGWTYFDVADSAEIADMIFNPNTRKMYVAVGGFGLARVDWSSAAANDTVDNTATTYTCTKDLVTRPLEGFAPRVDATVDNIGAHHLATAAQTSQTLTAHVSFDRGATYPYNNPVALDITEPRCQIDLFESEKSLTIKLSHVGKAGATIWAVSKLDLEVLSIGEEYPQVRSVSSGASL